MTDFAETEVNTQRAYGLASEAISTLRSNERIHDLRFASIEAQFTQVNGRFRGLSEDVANKQEELKELIEQTCKEMRDGFKSYDNKFWTLAVTTIVTLLAVCGFLIEYTLFSGHH